MVKGWVGESMKASHWPLSLNTKYKLSNGSWLFLVRFSCRTVDEAAMKIHPVCTCRTRSDMKGDKAPLARAKPWPILDTTKYKPLFLLLWFVCLMWCRVCCGSVDFCTCRNLVLERFANIANGFRVANLQFAVPRCISCKWNSVLKKRKKTKEPKERWTMSSPRSQTKFSRWHIATDMDFWIGFETIALGMKSSQSRRSSDTIWEQIQHFHQNSKLPETKYQINDFNK